DPDLERTGRTVESGRTVVIAADPDHAEMVAGESGEPGIALGIAGTGLAGGVQVAQASRADGPSASRVDDLLHTPGHQARGRHIVPGAGCHAIARQRLAVRIDDAAHRAQ